MAAFIVPTAVLGSFNTQPPEGGWGNIFHRHDVNECFNTQPPEGGWDCFILHKRFKEYVSTHSRLKAAGFRGSECA